MSAMKLSRDEEIDNIRSHNYHLGISAGYEGAAKRLMEMAKNQFAIGQDDLARVLRDISEAFVKTAIVEAETSKVYSNVISEESDEAQSCGG